MKLIHLDKIHSTNDYLKSLVLKQKLEDFTVVKADFQEAGKGQRGNKWLSEPGENLTMSLYKEFAYLPIIDQFKISMQTAIALYRALATLTDQVAIKWPNDLLLGGKKVGGVLIETSVKGSCISWVIIGIGININQTNFKGLPNATSILLHTTNKESPEYFFNILIPLLEKHLENVVLLPFKALKKEYESLLFGYLKPLKFEVKGVVFTGVIQGVTPLGALIVRNEAGTLKEFMLKEIKMVF